MCAITLSLFPKHWPEKRAQNLSIINVMQAEKRFFFCLFEYKYQSFAGFLNTNINPGRKPRMANYGLMDQIAALKWVQENIGYFGGDANSVTLFGHNRGAACIHYLMQSPAVVPGEKYFTL